MIMCPDGSLKHLYVNLLYNEVAQSLMGFKCSALSSFNSDYNYINNFGKDNNKIQALT
jgi:hypothetical protein